MVIERLIDRLKDDDDKKTIKEKIEENKPATSAGIYLKMKKRNGDLPHIKCDFNNMTIKPVETNKNRIFQRHLMKLNIIPKFSGVVILCGGIGSGKTTFLHNLLNRPEFYGISYEGIEEGKKPKPYFDHVFLMTGSDDDI